MLLIGAEGRNTGKTVFACNVIARFSRFFPLVALKVTTVRDGRGPCPRGGKGCGACASLEGPYCITEETDRAAGKDTSRMLQAGASRVFWARSRAEGLHACLASFRALLERGSVVVAESNSVARVVEPGLFLMVRETGAMAAKPSSREVLRHADRIVMSNGASFDLDPADLGVGDGGWQLLDASAAVLAGGSSARMGRDKSFLEIRGVPLVERLITQLRGRFREVLINADDREQFRSLGVPVVSDWQPGQGPLMGIAAALEAARSDLVFVVACDIPDVEPRLVRRLLRAARGADCAVPRVRRQVGAALFGLASQRPAGHPRRPFDDEAESRGGLPLDRRGGRRDWR